MIGYPNQQLFEGEDLAYFFKPVDLVTGVNTGIWLSFRGCHRMGIVLVRAGASGHSADQSTITLQQATSNAGAGAKALNVGRRRYKTDMTTAAGDTWTIDDTTTWANTYKSPSGFGDKLTLTAMDIEGQMLDDANGFHWVQASVDQAADSCLGWCFAIPYGIRHSQRVPVSCLTNL